MAVIRYTGRPVKKMKPMHGGGQPPVTSNASDVFFHYLTEAGIPYSRLHDVNGAFGGGKYVDIPNIFRDFDADENDPASYDFTFTDRLLKQLHEAKVEPYFRLGVTIENAAAVKSYWIYPPKDPEKWARICEHIVRHYTEGWANGFHYNITYWEIWGEPDNTDLWQGTPEEYFRLYHVTASHLKKYFPAIKVGGYGSCGFYAIANPPGSAVGQHYVRFFHQFFDYLKEHNSPIDFFSWHSYASTAETVKMAEWLDEALAAHGYDSIERHLNEWDPFAKEFGTGHHAAEMAAMMISMQKGRQDVCCIYDMRIANAPYCPLFNPITCKPVQGWYTMAAFHTLYKLGTQTEAEADTDGLYVLAAHDGKRRAMLIANLTGNTQPLSVEGADLTGARISTIDDQRLLSWTPNAAAIENNSVLLIEW